MRKFKYYILLMFAFSMLIMLPGCHSKNEIQTLWIVTEDSGQYGMNNITELCMEEFMKTHQNVKFHFDVLPTSEKERESRLEQLRVEIMSGKGPDIYLLPSVNEPYESLLTDVKRSMYNGFFLDISQYYEADKSINKIDLKQEIMDAGIMGGKRYVLPLRFDIPVLYVDEELIQESGLSTEVFSKNICQIYKEIQNVGDQSLAHGIIFDIEKYGLNVFPGFIDYENNKVLLEKEEIITFFNHYQKNLLLAESNKSESVSASVYSFVQDNQYWGNQNMPLFGNDLSLSDAMSLITFGEIAGKKLQMFPIQALDGSVIAEVTYWGAVGASCESPELAYEFIKMFLSEEAQWELNTENIYKESPALVSKGWPVLVTGATEHIWKIYRNQFRRTFYDGEDGWRIRNAKFLQSKLTDQDIPILEIKINDVQFTTDFEMKIYAKLVDDFGNDMLDVERTTDELLRQLMWYVSEG